MKKLLLILLCIFTFFACQKKQQKTIILSKASSNYVKWIEDENVIILDAYTIKNTDSILELADGDPLNVYNAVLKGEEIDGGREMTRKERVDLYRKSWMTVHFNEDESEDEAAVMKCLREELHFSKDEAKAIIEPLREKQKEDEYEDPKSLLEKMKKIIGR